MADQKTNADKPLDAGSTPSVVEAFPSVENGISALASANAPFIFFDSVAFYAYADGVGSITLSALRSIAAAPGQVASDRVITAHVRASLAALARLRGTIDGVIKMAEQQQQAANVDASIEQPTMQ